MPTKITHRDGRIGYVHGTRRASFADVMEYYIRWADGTDGWYTADELSIYY